MKQITGADLFVKALKKEAVDILFAYPGGQAIDLFDALYGEKEIDVILPRHEQGLIHAADGYARSTGKVGVCLVTSGPGAANLVTGIATANYDSDFYPEEIAVSGYEPDTSVHMGQLNKALDILNHAVKPVFLIGGGVLIAISVFMGAMRQMQRLSILMWMRHRFPAKLMWTFQSQPMRKRRTAHCLKRQGRSAFQNGQTKSTVGKRNI